MLAALGLLEGAVGRSPPFSFPEHFLGLTLVCGQHFPCSAHYVLCLGDSFGLLVTNPTEISVTMGLE